MTRATAFLLHQLLKEQGLTFAQLILLGEVSEGCVTITELSRVLVLHISACSMNSERLVQMGLLSRSEHPTDRRVHLLSLTDEGKAKLNAILAG